MAVVVAIFVYVLLQVDDVSAQTSCVISPDIASVTIADGLTRDIEFHCQCMDDNGMMITGTRWFLSDGTSAPTQNFNIPPAVLLIASRFNNTDAGTYICSPNNMQNDSSRDTITLSTGTPSGTHRICNIYSPSLTSDGGVMRIPIGTQNVILYCICRRMNVAVGPTYWFINGTRVNRTTASGNNPYSRDNVPAPLIIPSFTATHVGTYTCTSVENTVQTVDIATTDLALPGLLPPTNVRGTVLTPRSVEVTWTPPSSSDVTGYLISYTTTASYTSGGNVTLNGGSTTSHTLSNLEESTFYTIAIRATTSDGRMSGNVIVLVTTYTDVPSSPPQNVLVTSINPASLMVSWQPPPLIDHNGPITYMIQYTRVGTIDMMSVNVNSGTTQYTISGLVAYVDYTVTVAARTVNGTGPFSDPPVVFRSGEDAPSEPRSLEIVSVNSSSVTLQWSPPEILNGTIRQYSIQTSTIGILIISNNMLMGTVEGLSPDTVYVLQLRAHTGVGAGPPSNITVITSPGRISDVTVRNESVTSSTLTLEWMELDITNSNFSHYTVFYLPVRGPYGPIMASNRRKRQSAQAGELTMNFTGTTGTLTNLYGAVTYRIQVAVVTMSNGQELIGDRSSATEMTTLEGVPTAPHNLNYTDLTATGVTLTWRRPDPPNGVITQYNVSYIGTNSQGETSYDFTIQPVDICNSIESSYTWTDLIQGTYQFSVVASTSEGPGEAESLMLSTLTPTNDVAKEGMLFCRIKSWFSDHAPLSIQDRLHVKHRLLW